MPTDQERIKFAEDIILQTERIVHSTQDNEATEYWNHLLISITISKTQPIKDSDRVCIRPLHCQRSQSFNKDVALHFIPVYREDEAHCGFTAGLLNSSSGAEYHRNINMIIFNTTTPITSFEKGIMLLHEAGHAYHAFQNGVVGLKKGVLTY